MIQTLQKHTYEQQKSLICKKVIPEEFQLCWSLNKYPYRTSIRVKIQLISLACRCFEIPLREKPINRTFRNVHSLFTQGQKA